MAQGAIGSIAPRDTGGEKGESFVSFHGMPNRGRWERRRRRRKVGRGGGGNYLFAVVVGRRRRRGDRERGTEGLGRVLRWLTQASPFTVLGRRRSGILWAIGAAAQSQETPDAVQSPETHFDARVTRGNLPLSCLLYEGGREEPMAEVAIYCQRGLFK